MVADETFEIWGAGTVLWCPFDPRAGSTRSPSGFNLPQHSPSQDRRRASPSPRSSKSRSSGGESRRLESHPRRTSRSLGALALEMTKDLAHHGGIGQKREDSHRLAARTEQRPGRPRSPRRPFGSAAPTLASAVSSRPSTASLRYEPTRSPRASLPPQPSSDASPVPRQRNGRSSARDGVLAPGCAGGAGPGSPGRRKPPPDASWPACGGSARPIRPARGVRARAEPAGGSERVARALHRRRQPP